MTIYQPLNIWVEAVTGYSEDTVERWASVFREKKLFENVEIEKALSDFCRALEATERYAPFSSIFDTVMHFVDDNRDDFPGLPESLVINYEGSFENKTHPPFTSEEQGEQKELAAEQKSGVGDARKETTEDCVTPASCSLPAVSYEVKFTCPITGLLKKRKKHDRLLVMTGDTHAKVCYYCIVLHVFLISVI